MHRLIHRLMPFVLDLLDTARRHLNSTSISSKSMLCASINGDRGQASWRDGANPIGDALSKQHTQLANSRRMEAELHYGIIVNNATTISDANRTRTSGLLFVYISEP